MPEDLPNEADYGRPRLSSITFVEVLVGGIVGGLIYYAVFSGRVHISVLAGITTVAAVLFGSLVWRVVNVA